MTFPMHWLASLLEPKVVLLMVKLYICSGMDCYMVTGE